MNRFFITVVAAVVMLTSACSGVSSSPSPSEPAPSNYSNATFLTPLEARTRLQTLDVFANCANPTASDNDEVSSVSCLFEEGGSDWKTADRQVWVSVVRGGMSIDCQDAISPAMSEDYLVVTDDNNFVAVGLMNLANPALGPDTDNPTFKWPGEVWPEDVARVLGGKVVSAGQWCPEAFR